MYARRSSAVTSEASAGERARLALRRRVRRRRTLIALLIFLLALLTSFIWLSWQPYIRIHTLTISHDTEAHRAAVMRALQGTYAGIIPHDSFFFVPEHAIRESLMAGDQGIQAVSIRHDGLTGLKIVLNERVPIARWCGLQKTFGVPEYCYVFDANGFVFAAYATGTPVSNTFTVYDALAGSASEPLGATLLHTKAYPDLFELARKVGALGEPVKDIVLRDDEADLVLENGVRLTYVLGQEAPAYTDLVSAKNALNLKDVTIDYVDLRFPGKVYVKRKNGSVQE